MAGRIAYLGNIVTQGLVLDLDAAKKESYPGTGTSWNDISGNNINGTLVNGPTFDTGFGGSIVFDGTNDYANLSNPTSLQNLSEGTISMWLNRTATTATYQMMFTDDVSNLELSFLSNNLRFYIGNSNTLDYPLSTLNTWFMVTGVWSTSGNYKNLYVNSVLVRTSTNSLNTLSNIRYIGSRAGSFPFAGNISTTQIYTRALSQAEVTQNFNVYRSRYGI